MSKDTIIEKIRKLHAKARSAAEIGNEAEAAAFSAKVQELLVRHELEMTEVEYAERHDDDAIDSLYYDPSDAGGKRTKVRVAWQENLASVIARGFFCRILVIPGSNRIVFVGRKLHREMAVYVYSRLLHDVERMRKAARHEAYVAGGRSKKATVGFNAAFHNHFVAAVAQRMREAARARDEELKQSGNGTAIIRLQDAHAAVQKWMDQRHTRPASGVSGRQGFNAAGAAAGRAAGQRANLGADGVGGGAGGSKLLGR